MKLHNISLTISSYIYQKKILEYTRYHVASFVKLFTNFPPILSLYIKLAVGTFHSTLRFKHTETISHCLITKYKSTGAFECMIVPSPLPNFRNDVIYSEPPRYLNNNNKKQEYMVRRIYLASCSFSLCLSCCYFLCIHFSTTFFTKAYAISFAGAHVIKEPAIFLN